jgi:hypothetical protein
MKDNKRVKMGKDFFTPGFLDTIFEPRHGCPKDFKSGPRSKRGEQRGLATMGNDLMQRRAGPTQLG